MRLNDGFDDFAQHWDQLERTLASLLHIGAGVLAVVAMIAVLRWLARNFVATGLPPG